MELNDLRPLMARAHRHLSEWICQRQRAAAGRHWRSEALSLAMPPWSKRWWVTHASLHGESHDARGWRGGARHHNASAGRRCTPRCASFRVRAAGCWEYQAREKISPWTLQWLRALRNRGATNPTKRDDDFRKNLRNHGAPQARPEKEKARHECERVRSPSCRSINISLRLRQRTSHFSSLRCSEWSGWRRVCVFRLPVIQRADSAADSGIALADRSFITIPGVDGFFRGIRGGIWRDMAGYGGIPGDTGRYREIPGDTRYGRIRADTGRYGEIRGDAMRCKEIRGDTVRYCRDTSRYRKKAVRTRAITLLT